MNVISFEKKFNPKLKNIPFIDLVKKNHSLVKVKSVGLCGSDLHKFLSNKQPVSYLSNFILGHEISGIVVKSQDRRLLNKKVGVNPLIRCGSCSNCLIRSFISCSAYV